LSPVARRATVLGAQARHLPQRWDDESGVNLYYCADKGRGFFVEVGINDGQGRAVVLRSFVSSVPLDDYAHEVQLPE
jgi:hypothetical protein